MLHRSAPLMSTVGRGVALTTGAVPALPVDAPVSAELVELQPLTHSAVVTITVNASKPVGNDAKRDFIVGMV